LSYYADLQLAGILWRTVVYQYHMSTGAKVKHLPLTRSFMLFLISALTITALIRIFIPIFLYQVPIKTAFNYRYR